MPTDSPDPASSSASEDDEIVDAELLDADGDDVDPGEGGPELNDLLGSLGGLDMSSLLDSAVQMQQDMLAAQAATAEQEFEGQSGGGVVRVVVTGAMEFRSVTLSPEVVDPDDIEMLQDLILAALHDATQRAVTAAAASMPALPGMDLLGGLAGSGEPGGFDLSALLGGADDDEQDEPIDDDGAE